MEKSTINCDNIADCTKYGKRDKSKPKTKKLFGLIELHPLYCKDCTSNKTRDYYNGG